MEIQTPTIYQVASDGNICGFLVVICYTTHSRKKLQNVIKKIKARWIMKNTQYN
jgi:hypothetical protein